MKKRIEKLQDWHDRIAVNSKIFTRYLTDGQPWHLTQSQYEHKCLCQARCIDRQRKLFNQLAKSIEI
jgi:hypothetical protein